MEVSELSLSKIETAGSIDGLVASAAHGNGGGRLSLLMSRQSIGLRAISRRCNFLALGPFAGCIAIQHGAQSARISLISAIGRSMVADWRLASLRC